LYKTLDEVNNLAQQKNFHWILRPTFDVWCSSFNKQRKHVKINYMIITSNTCSQKKIHTRTCSR